MSAALPLADPVPLRQDARTIGVVGLAHGTSHFFHLLLPPMFPWLTQEFDLSYSQLGLLVSAFFVISGVGQALSGFLVDRVGARPVLFYALACFVAAGLAAAAARGYGGLLLASMLAGLGNAPFHPIDFTILNKRVSKPRLGHAFSVHGVTGNLGWALAPVFLVGVATVAGSWRMAYLSAALLATLVLLLVLAQRHAIDDRVGEWHAHEAPDRTVKVEHPMAFLRLPSVWMCFSFFFWTTCAWTGIQSFAGPALQQLYGLPLTVTSLAVTGALLCGAAGMIVGGYLVPRIERLERTIGAALMAAVLMLALAGAGWLGAVGSVGLVVLAGFGIGLAGPSRDMLVRSAAPPGATGRVYGTVYSGLDLGFAVSAPVFGILLDGAQAYGVFYGAALSLSAAVLSAMAVGAVVAARRRTAEAVA